MARDDLPQGLMPSMLDRLIDPSSGGSSARRGYSLSEMIDSVRRDLEELLNTRLCDEPVPETYPELARSIFNYGMPELFQMDVSEADEVGRILEAVVTRFEPRCAVRAKVPAPAGPNDRSMRFHIEGRLRVDPSPDVEYETVLELSSGRSMVRSTS